jgi:ERF superfamily
VNVEATVAGEQEEVAMSPSVSTLAAAMSRVQAKIHSARKDKSNPHFRSRYADLGSVWEACREQLTAEGFAVLQLTHGTPDVPAVTTILLHSSGEWVRSTLRLRPVKIDPQGVGSALTYARRYALSAMVGVVADDDDDGNSASTRQALQECVNMARALNLSDSAFIDNIEAYYQTRDLNALRPEQVQSLHTRLRAALAAQKQNVASSELEADMQEEVL